MALQPAEVSSISAQRALQPTRPDFTKPKSGHLPFCGSSGCPESRNNLARRRYRSPKSDSRGCKSPCCRGLSPCIGCGDDCPHPTRRRQLAKEITPKGSGALQGASTIDPGGRRKFAGCGALPIDGVELHSSRPSKDSGVTPGPAAVGRPSLSRPRPSACDCPRRLWSRRACQARQVLVGFLACVR